MKDRIGIATKQRIREAVWDAIQISPKMPSMKFGDILLKKLQNYFFCYPNRSNRGESTYILLKSKAIVELPKDVMTDNIDQYMEETRLPGAQVCYWASDQPCTIHWFSINAARDGDIEQLTSNPAELRSFSLDEPTKDILRHSFELSNRESWGQSQLNLIHKDLQRSFPECYKEHHVRTFMPDITILEVCVIDITNRNRGLILASDVKQMKKYIHELLLPGILVNYTDGNLFSILWFSCNESKIGMSIEFYSNRLKEIPDFQLDNDTKDNIRKIVSRVREDPSIKTESDYQTAVFDYLLTSYGENKTTRKKQKDSIIDIILEDSCIIDVRFRKRGIVTTADEHHMEDIILSYKLPGAQISFIDKDSEVILWFGTKNGNVYVEVEAIGEDPTGMSLVDLFCKQ